MDVCMGHEICLSLKWRLPHGPHSASERVLRGSAMKNIEDCTTIIVLSLLSQNDKQTPRLQLGIVAEMGEHGRHLSGMWGDVVSGSCHSTASKAQLQRSCAQLAQEEHFGQTQQRSLHGALLQAPFDTVSDL